MSEFKNASNEEKITHYLGDELSPEEKSELELEFKKDPHLALEFKKSQALISLINADKSALLLDSGIGEIRKGKVFEKKLNQESVKKDARIINRFKSLRFTLAAAALVLLSFIILPEMWKAKTTESLPPTHSPSVVLGVHSFNMALQSGK